MYRLSNFEHGKGPREKLIEKGPDMLSNAELLATIFITGTKTENVLELSSRVLKEYGSRSIISIQDVGKIVDMLGLGPAKASQLVAIFELGRRFYLENSKAMPSIWGPEDVWKIYKNMKELKKEETRSIYLNSRQKLIREDLIAVGNENMNIINIKEILQPAIEIFARGIIVIHNHPSGKIEPSDADTSFTKKLKAACDIMGLNFVDHIVIGTEGYFSFSQYDLI